VNDGPLSELSCADATARMSLTPSRSGARGEQDAAFRPVIALAFWCCLGISAALFAAVTLAPKLRSYRELRHEYDALERKLAVEERQVQHLQQVADALRNDPDFASELARADFGTDDSEERIPVDPRLNLDDASKLNAAVRQAAADEARGLDSAAVLDTALLDRLCDSPPLRRSLLAAGGFLILVGFTFLSGDARLVTGPDLNTRLRDWLTSRYRKSNT
jgi:hypothetical protein